MWELNHKEGWTLKNWCLQILMLEKTLGSPLDSKEIKPVNAKGNQAWMFIGRTDAETEVPVLWPPDAKSRLIGKDLDAGKDRGQGEKGKTGWDGGMASLTQWTWVWTNSGSEAQGSLACCSPWGHKELDTTEWLNSNKYSIEKHKTVNHNAVCSRCSL